MTNPEVMTEPVAMRAEHVYPCWLWAALVVSLAAVAGSLLLTWGLGLTACTLCFYQRVFAMTAAGCLALGVLLPELKPGRASLFALPSVMGGFGVALFHVNLVVSGKLECPSGLFELGTAPVQSLAVFALLFVLVGGDLIQAGKSGFGIRAAGFCVAVLGLLFAVALIFSSPPLPDARTYDYKKPFVICRPPQPQ